MIRLGIDVDNTVVSHEKEWKEWSKKHNLKLDLTKEVTNPKLLEFWKQEDLYDNIKPIPSAVKAINNLYNTSMYEIIFVSHCFPEHIQSKINFLNKYFKYHSFVNTKDKHLLNLDILIDDRDFFTDEIPIKILIKTDLETDAKIDYVMDWDEIYNFLKTEQVKQILSRKKI